MTDDGSYAARKLADADIQVPGYIPGTWQIDAAHSHVGFAIKHMMVSKVRGRFGSFAGVIVTAPHPSKSVVSATIDAASIDTGNKDRDAHVRSAEFLDCATYPILRFESTGVRCEMGQLYVDGRLTVRGVTRQVTLATEVPQFLPVADGAAKAGFAATTEINRSDYGIAYSGSIPGGGMALGEKVQIILEIEAEFSPQAASRPAIPGNRSSNDAS